MNTKQKVTVTCELQNNCTQSSNIFFKNMQIREKNMEVRYGARK